MSINQDILKLERAINCEYNCRDPEGLYKRIYSSLDKRVKRLNDKYPEIGLSYNPLPRPKDARLNEQEIELMKTLNGWDVDVVYNYAQINEKIDESILTYGSGDSNRVIPAIRFRKRIIFKNPKPSLKDRTKHIRSSFITDDGVAQCWSNPQVNLSYNKHSSFSSNNNSSKYFDAINRADVEFAAFNNGLGYVVDSNPVKTMFLYASFSDYIGSLSKTGFKSNIVKIQVDRIVGLKDGNCSIHGFPISEPEIVDELGEERTNLVLLNPLSL